MSARCVSRLPGVYCVAAPRAGTAVNARLHGCCHIVSLLAAHEPAHQHNKSGQSPAQNATPYIPHIHHTCVCVNTWSKGESLASHACVLSAIHSLAHTGSAPTKPTPYKTGATHTLWCDIKSPPSSQHIEAEETTTAAAGAQQTKHNTHTTATAGAFDQPATTTPEGTCTGDTHKLLHLLQLTACCS